MANAFKNKTHAEIGTSLTKIQGYDCPGSTETTIIGLTIANRVATVIQVDVTLNDASDDYYVVKDAPVPAGGALVVVGGDQKLVMMPGDSIKVKSDTASSADVIMSILEIT